MYTIERHVGRLVELRQIAAVPIGLPEIVALRETLERTVRAATELVVVCADLRLATLFAPPVADEVADMMRMLNPRLLRSAIVLPPDRATFSLQMERLVRAAGAASRRTFRNPAMARAWLSEVLSPEESSRVEAFLAD